MGSSDAEERNEERSPNISINNSPGDHRIVGRDLIEVNMHFGNVGSGAESHSEEKEEREQALSQTPEIKLLVAAIQTAIRSFIPSNQKEIRFPAGGQKARTN